MPKGCAEAPASFASLMMRSSASSRLAKVPTPCRRQDVDRAGNLLETAQFAEPTAGERQQPDASYRLPAFRPALLHLDQGLAEQAILLRREPSSLDHPSP